MRLIKNTYHMLHASEPLVVADAPVPTATRATSLSGWLLGALLVVAIIASSFIGNANRPKNELDWLSQLANGNDAGAQLQLGLAYLDGRYGLSPNAKTGLYWLRRSAVLGNAYAEDAIGSAYAKGEGIAHNAQLAEQWYRKAMRDGDDNARKQLVDLLVQSGRITEANKLMM